MRPTTTFEYGPRRMPHLDYLHLPDWLLAAAHSASAGEGVRLCAAANSRS